MCEKCNWTAVLPDYAFCDCGCDGEYDCDEREALLAQQQRRLQSAPVIVLEEEELD